MKNKPHPGLAGLAAQSARGLLAVLALSLGSALLAASTDIANTPIYGTAISQATPNIMLLMDTSKSILFTHAPNALEGTSLPPPAAQPIGYRANQCNSIYYNPATVYELAADGAGAKLPLPAFAAAPYNYFTPSGNVSSPNGRASVDLNSQFQAFDRNTRARNAPDANDPEQRAYYYVYTPTAGLTPATLPYAAAPCTDAYDPALYSVATTGGHWQRVLVGDPADPSIASKLKTVLNVPQDERQNFANWYTYYRTRVALTKSGFGRAFDHLTNEFRVGLINGNPLERASTDAKPPVDAKVDSAAYLALGGFTAEHKKDWYTKLYAQVPGGSSPMREGLARVGRHYANKDDLINKGMTLQSATDDHSCRQNFTIMTTGGYWSQFAETRGAVQIDGTSLVGQQDGVIDAKVTVDGATYDISPRPIWDGGTTGKRITTDKWNDYRSFSCLTNQVTMSTAQTLAATVQKKQSSSQITTSQKTQTRSTHQMQQSTEQDVQQTLQTLKTTRQGKAHTVVFTLSTSQATKTVSYAIAYVTTPTQRTHQRLKTTSSTLKTTSQFKVSSSQLQVSTSQAQKTTQTTTKTTSQLRQSTSQLQLSSTQPNRTTTQFTRSTSQLLQTTDQSTASTSQWWATSSQNSTPVPSCTPSTEITCTHVTTPAIPVALDTTGVCSAPPSSGLSTWTVLGSANNGYIDTICVNIHTGPVGVLVCGTSTPLQTVACTLVKTGPTPMYRCIPPTFDAQAVDWGSGYAYNYDNYLAPGKTYGQGGPADQYAPHGGTAVYPDALWYQQNNNTTTTCGTVSTGPTPVDSCTNTDATSANAWTAITCTAVTTGPTPAKICNQGTDANYVTTTCNTVTTGPTGVSSCTESGSASVDPYLVTTCDTATSSTPVAPADCTAGTDANYVVTTCPTITTGPTPVKAGDCTEGTVGAVTTTCPVATTGPTPVASCSGSGDVNVSPYLVTSCHTVITGPTGVSGCTASGSASVDPYLQIFCDHPTSSSTVAPADCTAGTDVNYVVTTCTPTTLGPTPVPAGDCTEGTVGAVTTSCSFNDSAFTAVESCTPSTGPGPDYIDIECGTSTGYGNGAQVCVEGPGVVCEQHTFVEPTTTPCVAPPPSAPWWTTTVCNPPTVTGPTPVYSCTEGVTGSDTVYPYLVSTCVKTPGPSNYTPQPCSDVFGTSPDYVHKVCEIPVDTGPLGVQTGTCIADPGTSAPYLKVECTAPVTTWKPVAPGSCQLQKQVADETNGWKTINCDTQPTGPTLATSIDGTTFNCTTAPATEPLWTRTTCTPVDEGPTAVDPTDPTSCASAISAGLTKTTVCSTSQTPPVAQNATSCAGLDVAATEPNWVATVCSTVPTGPTPADPVACEAAKLIQPSPGNGYVTTTCDTFTTPATPVAACTAYTVGGPGTTPATDLAHQYTSTTCSSNPTDPTPVAATLCTAYTVGGLGTTPETDLAHQYTSTTCTTLPGRLVYYVTTEKITTATVSGGQVVTDPPATVTTSIVTAGGYYSAYLDNP
ncbi:MAG: hypothetical protein WCH44_02375, partial [Betaproteobacteria bacterium]